MPKLRDLVLGAPSRPTESDYPTHLDPSRTNTIVITSLEGPESVSSFIHSARKALKNTKRKELSLDCTELKERQFPNACVPIASMVQMLVKDGYKVTWVGAETILPTMGIDNPVPASHSELTSARTVFSRIWKFSDSNEVHDFVMELMKELSGTTSLATGTLRGLDLCLYEVMDNVLRHSGENEGYVMAQMHQSTKRVAICVADNGRGILQTLKPRYPKLLTSADAIVHATQEGVTRDPVGGQGNGLWVLQKVLSANQGRLTVTSGDSVVSFENPPRPRTGLRVLRKRVNPMSIIDVQYDANNQVDLQELMPGKSCSGFYIDSLECDDSELYNLDISKWPHGFGTRMAGQKLRVHALNYLNEARLPIALDFTDVHIVSASFADEVVGKLAQEMGFCEFQQMIRLKGLSKDSRTIVNKVTEKRLSSPAAP